MSLGIGKNIYLDFDTAARVLELYCKVGKLSVRQAEATLGYNSAKIFGYRSWLKAMNMIEVTPQGVVPTILCHIIRAHDPVLTLLETRQILYYEISTNPKAEVWYSAVNYVLYDAFLYGRQFRADVIGEALVSLGVGANSAAMKQRDRDARLCLNALTSQKSFGCLNLLTSTGTAGKLLGIQRQVPQPLLLAYDLAKHGSPSVPYHRLEELPGPGRAARVFFWGAQELEQALGWLEAKRFVHVIRSAGLNQVAWSHDGSNIDVTELIYERCRKY